MRDYSIVNITPSAVPTVPSTFELSFDQTVSFHGKEWIDGAGSRFPFYTYDTDPLTITPPAPPLGTGVLLATTFEVVDNPKYNGRYTVYTKPSAGGLESSEVVLGNTIIRVNETMEPGVGAELTTGRITAISTYLISVFGESPLLVLEQQNLETRPIEFTGHRTSGWGEVMFKNLLDGTQNYAGPSAPANPFVGQLWYDTANNLLMIREFATWSIVNSAYTGLPPFYFTQVGASVTWTITHNFGLGVPYTCSTDFFVDIGAGVHKSILPSDVTYNGPNQLTATFSVAYAGRAIIRA